MGWVWGWKFRPHSSPGKITYTQAHPLGKDASIPRVPSVAVNGTQHKITTEDSVHQTALKRHGAESILMRVTRLKGGGRERGVRK